MNPKILFAITFTIQWLIIRIKCSIVSYNEYKKITNDIKSYKLIRSSAITHEYFNKYNTLLNKVSRCGSTPEICLWNTTIDISYVEHVCKIAAVKLFETGANSEFEDPVTIGSGLTPYSKCYQKSVKNVKSRGFCSKKQAIYCSPTYIYHLFAETTDYVAINGFFLGSGDDRINSNFVYKLSNHTGDAMNLMYYMYDIMETDPIIIDSNEFNSIKYEPEMRMEITGIEKSIVRFIEYERKYGFSTRNKQHQKDFCNLEKIIKYCKYLAVVKYEFAAYEDDEDTPTSYDVISNLDATDRSGFVPYKCVNRRTHYEAENQSRRKTNLIMNYCPDQIFKTVKIPYRQRGFFFSAGNHEKFSVFLHRARFAEVDGVKQLTGIFIENYVIW